MPNGVTLLRLRYKNSQASGPCSHSSANARTASIAINSAWLGNRHKFKSMCLQQSMYSRPLCHQRALLSPSFLMLLHVKRQLQAILQSSKSHASNV
eukprot:1930610-Amphidinium_carterae.1